MQSQFPAESESRLATHATDNRLLQASRRSVTGWGHMWGGNGNPQRWDAAMHDLMHLVDEYDDRDLSSSDSRLLDVARNAVDSWVNRRRTRRRDWSDADRAMRDLETLIKAIDGPAWRRMLRAHLTAVAFLAGMVAGAFLHWIVVAR